MPRRLPASLPLLLVLLSCPGAALAAAKREAPLPAPPRIATAPGDPSWLLEPRVFDRLSAGGRRMAFRLNGLPLPAIERSLPVLASPRAERAAEAALFPRQNVRVNDPSMDQSGHTNSESSVAVRGNSVVVAFNDATQDAVAGYASSTDGGATFTHRRLPVPPGGGTYGDPVVAFGPGGEVYYSTLTINDSGLSSIGVSKSTDGGATFGIPADVAWSVSSPYSAQDKDWLAVDAGASSPYKGHVYVTWTIFLSDGRIGIAFSRSTDGGQTFDPAIAVSYVDTYGVQNSVIAVAPNGDVYVAYEDGHISPDGIAIIKSVDGGLNWSNLTAVVSVTPFFFLTGCGGVRASSYPTMAIDGKGVLHLAWAAPDSKATTDRSDVLYSRSTDGAKSFGTPRKLNDDGTATSQAFPALAAAADGSVAVRWADRRNDPQNDGLTDVYVAISPDSGVSFGKNVRITDHNWSYGPVERSLTSAYHGDYDGIATDGNGFFVSWSDERGTDPDVYLAWLPAAFDPSTGDFNVSSRQLYGAVLAGQQLAFDLVTSAANGFSGSLALSAVSTIPGLQPSLSTSSVAPGQGARLTVSTASTLPPGDYLLTVRATAGGLTRSTNVRFTVYDPFRGVPPPTNATATPGFTSGAGVKADASGVLHLLYDDDSSAVLSSDVFYRRSTDGGRTFSAPLKLTPSGTLGQDPQLAFDASGRVVAVWTGRAPGESNNRVWVARSTDGGATFATAVAVTPSSQYAQYPVVAIDRSGNVVVAYFDASQSSPPIFTSRSANGGSSFASPVQLLESGTASITRPGLAFDSKGNAYLVYTQQVYSVSSGLTSVARVAVAGSGGVFSTITTVSQPSVAYGFGPDVAIASDDTVYVAFYYRFGTTVLDFNREVYVTRSSDLGKTFTSFVNVSAAGGQSYFPSIAVEPGGAVDVVWEDTRGNAQTDVFFARSVDGGRSFSPPLNVSANLGLSGSEANPWEGVGGSGRPAVTAGASGNVVVSWTDDSPSNPDILYSVLQPGAINLPPTAAIAFPGPGFSVEAGVSVAFTGTGTDPNGDPVTLTWTFGDGSAGSGTNPTPHPFARPGSNTVTLTARDPQGATGTATVTVTVTSPTVTGTSLLLPVVVETPGVGGSFYISEVTLVSRATTSTEVLLQYTASVGEGSGFARLTLGPGEQRIQTSVLAYLRGRNVPIPSDRDGHVGTLLVTFGGVGSPELVFAGARTYTADPSGGAGTFGLFYGAAQTTDTTATIFGLQQNDSQRSNVAVVNAGPNPITLRVSLQGANAEDLGALPDQDLGPWGWAQFAQPLLGKASSGRAVVTRVSGTSPFSAYGVLNDAVTSDGSFLPPLLTSTSADRLLPIVLDVQGIGARYRTEVTLANLSNVALPLTLVYRAASGFGSGSGSVPLTLNPGEQRIVPDVIAFLRTVLPIESDGRNVAGSLLVQAASGTLSSALAVGARTFAPAVPSGTFGLFYPGLTADESASANPVFVYGLQENASQRSNLAVVNRGDASDAVTLRVTWYDAGGAVLGTPVERTLAPGDWYQFPSPLSAFGAASGYAKIERTSGSSRYAAYGVLNDNTTSDGSYLPMTP